MSLRTSFRLALIAAFLLAPLAAPPAQAASSCAAAAGLSCIVTCVTGGELNYVIEGTGGGSVSGCGVSVSCPGPCYGTVPTTQGTARCQSAAGSAISCTTTA